MCTNQWKQVKAKNQVEIVGYRILSLNLNLILKMQVLIAPVLGQVLSEAWHSVSHEVSLLGLVFIFLAKRSFPFEI